MMNNIYDYKKTCQSIYKQSLKGFSNGDLFESIFDYFDKDYVLAKELDSFNRKITVIIDKEKNIISSDIIFDINNMVHDYIKNNISETVLNGFPEFVDKKENLFDYYYIGNSLIFQF